jgi:hypothetical protein
VPGDDEVDGRALDAVDDADDRALPLGGGRPVHAVGAGGGALVDHDDLDAHALPLEPRRLLPDALRLVEEREPLGGAGAHELRRRPRGGADDADPHAVDPEDRRRVHPRRRLTRRLLDDVRRQEREVGALEVLEDPLDAVVELVVAVRRGVHAPRVLHVDRRPVLEQRRARRRRADVVARGEQQRPPGQRGRLLVEHRRELPRPADVDREAVDRRGGL